MSYCVVRLCFTAFWLGQFQILQLSGDRLHFAEFGEMKPKNHHYLCVLRFHGRSDAFSDGERKQTHSFVERASLCFSADPDSAAKQNSRLSAGFYGRKQFCSEGLQVIKTLQGIVFKISTLAL